MTAAEVRRRREAPEDSTLSVYIPEDIKAETRSRHEELWNLTVEEFESLRDENGAARVLLGVPDVPIDVAGRYRALQNLLRFKPEFETRYPAAFEVLFPEAVQRRQLAGLYLPSFEVRVLNNWILPHAFESTAYSGADAHTSVSRWWQKDWFHREANRDMGRLDLDDLQGILLAILTREEDGERVGISSPIAYISGDVEGVRSPSEAPIRLTDLRLAESLGPNILQRGIQCVLDSLHKPLSTDHVVLWKLTVLGSGDDALPDMILGSTAEHLVRIPCSEIPEEASEYVAEMKEYYEQGIESGVGRHLISPMATRSALLAEQFGDEETGTKAVSFAAAALWLFLDLDMPGVERASSYRLTEQIESLASTVRKLIRHLRRSTEELGKLTANKSAGAEPEIPYNNYQALRHYRMGHFDLRGAAEWLGLTPYSSRTGKGTRDWKARVKQRLREGKNFEDDNFPQASAIFANRDNPFVRYKARRAYRGYLIEKGRTRFPRYAMIARTAGISRVETKRGVEIISAYIHLGSCILQGIDPVP